MASGILFAVVVSVTMAMTSGQQHAREAQQRIAGTLAAEELMGRVAMTDYTDLNSTWSGSTESPGDMVDGDGEPFPAQFDGVGREISMTSEQNVLTGYLGIRLRGRLVTVRAFDENNRTLAKLERLFVRPRP